MAFVENLSLFLDDFGVTCTSGAITAKGILDMPSEVIADGVVLTTNYTLIARASDFGGLLYGDSITVDRINYQVREVRLLNDGAMVQVDLMKLAPGATAPGGQPREFGLADLADVELSSPEAGEALKYDGTNWVDAPDGAETRIDTSTAGTIYVGRAPNGASEGASMWEIVRTTYSAAGIRLTRGTATGVTWTGRTSHTYA